jgi:hypothetical protein
MQSMVPNTHFAVTPLECERNPASPAGHPQWNVRLAREDVEGNGICAGKVNIYKPRDAMSCWIFVNSTERVPEGEPIWLRREPTPDHVQQRDPTLTENYMYAGRVDATGSAASTDEEDNTGPTAPAPAPAVLMPRPGVAMAGPEATQNELTLRIGFHVVELVTLLKKLQVLE